MCTTQQALIVDNKHLLHTLVSCPEMVKDAILERKEKAETNSLRSSI